MEECGVHSDACRGSSTTASTSNRYHRSTRFNGNDHVSASNFFRSPLSTFLEYTGTFRTRGSSHSESSDSLINSWFAQNNFSGAGDDHREVSITIIGGGEQEHGGEVGGVVLPSSTVEQVREGTAAHNEASIQTISRMDSAVVLDTRGDSWSDGGVSIEGNSHFVNGSVDVEASDGLGVNNTRDSSYQRYDMHLAATSIEQLLPFSLLLLVVFIRQHLQDTLVRQAAMVPKCFLLMYYKNSRRRNYRKQGQMLTLVEYLVLLYRALLPVPVWYRFFLNKEYGSLCSLLTTGLYLTFKLISLVEKVQSFLSALKALCHKEIRYGTYATTEQVNAAGDLCAICQETMHAPVVLCCKHIFCEDCVSEWFERERTCPLCREVVKPADLRSFADGSTSLFFRLF